jgi:hypothetical protein
MTIPEIPRRADQDLGVAGDGPLEAPSLRFSRAVGVPLAWGISLPVGFGYIVAIDTKPLPGVLSISLRDRRVESATSGSPPPG